MQTNTKRGAALLGALLMVAAAMTGGIASGASPTVDSGITTANGGSGTHNRLASTTDVVDNDNFTGFNGSGEGDLGRVQYQADSNDSEVNITQPGVEDDIYVNGSADLAKWNQSASPDHGHFNVTVENESLLDMERSIDDNVTTTWWIRNNTNRSSTDHYDTQKLTVYIETDNSTTVENIDNGDVDDDDDLVPSAGDVQTEALLGDGARIGASDSFSHIEAEDREVDGDTTDVVVVFSNGTVADDFDEAVDDVDDEAAAFSIPAVVEADDGPNKAIRVYNGEAPDSVDEDGDTYGVYKSDYGGEQAVEVNLGDEYEDAEEVTVITKANVGWIAALQHRAATSAFNPMNALGGLSVDVDGLMTALALVVAAPGRRKRPPATVEA